MATAFEERVGMDTSAGHWSVGQVAVLVSAALVTVYFVIQWAAGESEQLFRDLDIRAEARPHLIRAGRSWQSSLRDVISRHISWEHVSCSGRTLYNGIPEDGRGVEECPLTRDVQQRTWTLESEHERICACAMDCLADDTQRETGEMSRVFHDVQSDEDTWDDILEALDRVRMWGDDQGSPARERERQARLQYLSHMTQDDVVSPPSAEEPSIDQKPWEAILGDISSGPNGLDLQESPSNQINIAAEEGNNAPPETTSVTSMNGTHRHHPILKQERSAPSKVKNLRFKPEPDIFDILPDSSDTDDSDVSASNGKKAPRKYRVYPSEDGTLVRDPVSIERKVLPVRTSLVTTANKMVAVVRESNDDRILTRVTVKEVEPKLVSVIDVEPKVVTVSFPEDSDEGPEKVTVIENEKPNVYTGAIESVVNGDAPPKKAHPPPVAKKPIYKRPDHRNNYRIKRPVPPPPPPKPIFQNKTANERRPLVFKRKVKPDMAQVERITGYQAATSVSKPPIPPLKILIPTDQTPNNARRHYFDAKSAGAVKVTGERFQDFLQKTQNDRRKIAQSSPDIAELEKSVRNTWAIQLREKAKVHEKLSERQTNKNVAPEDVWASYVNKVQRNAARRSRSLGILETDVDTCTTTETTPGSVTTLVSDPGMTSSRSVEYIEPESPLLGSKHALRVQRSLQNLSVPDWYKRSEWSRRPKEGFLLGKKSRPIGWEAAKSVTSSTSSLASVPENGPVYRRPELRSLGSSQENLLWSSPCLSRWDRSNSGPLFNQGMVWRASNRSPSPDVFNHHLNSYLFPVEESADPPACQTDSKSEDAERTSQLFTPKNRYSYVQSIYHSERDLMSSLNKDPPTKVIWIESSFVGSRTTTSVVVLPCSHLENLDLSSTEESLERPASR